MHTGNKSDTRRAQSAMHCTARRPDTAAGKRGLQKLQGLRLRQTVYAVLLASAPCGWCQVSGGQVTSGGAQITQTVQNGTTTTITQTTETATISWRTFNVGAADTVNFVQPSKQSLTINRIADPNGSQIMGRIQATGQVWLINPNGVLFGKGAQINVGSILASALAIGDPPDNRGQGNWSVSARGQSLAEVSNQGHINVASDGYAVLLAHRVTNSGSISAPAGAAVLGAGSAISLQFQNNKLLGIEVDQHQLDAMVSNSGQISADGGQVLLSAGARASLLASAVNNTGLVQARTVAMQEGKIVLSAGGQAGRVLAGGSADASAPQGGNGGQVDITGAKVQVAADLQVDTSAYQGRTGQLGISATDWSIERSPAPEALNTIAGDHVGRLLASNHLRLTTGLLGDVPGDIAINAAISWNAPTTLSLRAAGNVVLNDVLSAAHAQGALHLGYGLASADGVINGRQADYRVQAPVNLRAGTNFSTQLGSQGPLKTFTVITALGRAGSTTGVDLQGISQAPERLAQNYVLGADIDASETANWNKGAGFKPLFLGSAETDINSFQGTFDGLGHVITGLVINRPTIGAQALFSSLGKQGLIQNLGLRNIAYTTNNTGGLVFRNFGTVRNSFVDGGYIQAGDNFSNLSNYIGGLVGSNMGRIEDCYANLVVSMNDRLASYRSDPGFNYKIGGLVGTNAGSIINSYASGQVVASDRTVTVNGVVSPLIYKGGLVGADVGASGTSGSAVVASYWLSPADESLAVNGAGWSQARRAIGMQNTGAVRSDSSLTLTAAQASRADSYGGWNLGQNWLLYEGHGTPYLRAFMTPLYVQISNPSEKTYDGQRSIAFTTNTPLQVGNKFLGGEVLAQLEDKNAGIQQVKASGLYSDQGGYQVRYAYQQATVLVTKAKLEVSGVTAQDKTYDGTNYASVNTSGLRMDGLVAGDDVTVNVSASFQSKDAGVGRPVLLEAGMAGADRGNYVLAMQPDTQATITKAPLQYVADPAKVYIGDSLDKLTGSVIGFVGQDTLANAARGTPKWQSDAGAGLNQGVFGIFGTGLEFDNYAITQAPANAQALRITAYEAPVEVRQTVTRAVQEGSRGEAIAALPATPVSAAEVPAEAPSQAGTELGAKQAQEKDEAKQRKPVRVGMALPCWPDLQKLGASVRIACLAREGSSNK